ncbi:hypothetical protein [Lacinutrix sp. Hel_I_90]|uniref:hypothetical protein n=1 Tax=Lacinutrix sp. Hel_I_90 TaxID=1249999 RepID=UPI0005CA2482|nr:hypothetical protein [Lacinutrix sp. Hel_I_90]
MNTKILMITSAIILGIMGLGLTFLPEEISEVLGMKTNQVSLLTIQILGATYLGFAMLNWMTKNNLIGGIYSRPLVIGNLVHFLVSSFALIKMLLHLENHIEIIVTLTIVYFILTLGFGYVFMTNPSKIAKTE